MPFSTEEAQTINLCPSDPNRSAESGPLKELLAFLSPGDEGTFRRLGRYHILDVLGQGGFGIVVKAVDPTLQRFVAIKILSPRLAVTSPPRKYFLREARSAAQVRHEHVVQIHCVEEEPLPYLVMEYIEGETLQQRLDRTGPLEPEEAVRVGRQIALGLAAAHAVGLVHRDIKPANIMLEKGEPPVVKITDFGIARTADDASLTASNVIIGTPMYMSPEQANGAAVDQRSDLFSLGSVLYTMVSGRAPFRAPQTMAVLKRIVEDKPRSLQEVNPAVGAGLAAVIARLHAKSPEDRYSSAVEVAQALETCLCENPAPAPRKRGKVASRAAALAALVLLAAAIGISWVGIAGRGGATPPRAVNTPLPSEATRPAEVVRAVPAASPDIDKVLAGASREVAWENAVAAMPVEDQVPAVNARLRTLNAKYDGAGITCTIKNGAVDTLSLWSAEITDLTPVRALKELRELTITTPYVDGGPLQGALNDLSPLRGMKLEGFHTTNASIKDLSPLADLPLKSLTVWGFMGRDLTPLQVMKLTYLNCGCSKVNDLAPLRGMPLEFLCVNMSDVADLSPLAGMKLKTLLIAHTKVTDLTPIWDMPLEDLLMPGMPLADLHHLRDLPLKHLELEFDPAQDLELLRSIKTLELVNNQPVAAFLAKTGK